MENSSNISESRDNRLLCQLCLSKDDLIRITIAKERLINSLLSIKITKNSTTRICINCSYALTSFDKFRKNAEMTQNVLESSQDTTKISLNILSETDESTSAAFETVLSWLTDVNVILKHFPTKISVHSFEKVEKSNKIPEKEQISERITTPERPEIQETEEINSNLVNFEMELEDDVASEESVHIKDEINLEQTSNFDENEEIDDQSSTSLEEGEIRKEPELEDIPAEIAKFNPDEHFDKINGPANRNYKCPILECGKYYFRAELIHHFYAHFDYKPFKCPSTECSHTSANPYNLIKHMRFRHKITDENAKIYSRYSEELAKMDKYYVLELKSAARPFRCPECHKNFTRQELYYHFNVHKNVRPFKCNFETCPKAYFNPYDLAAHSKKLHNIQLSTKMMFDPTLARQEKATNSPQLLKKPKIT